MLKLLRAIKAVLIGLVTDHQSAGTQQQVAQINADKDITLQRERLQADRNQIERGKLEKILVVVSLVQFEYSLTMSHIQSRGMNLIDIAAADCFLNFMVRKADA